MSQSLEYRLVFKNLPFGITNSRKDQKIYIHKLLNDIQSELERFELNRDNMSIHLNVDWSIAINDIERNMEKNFFMDDIHTEFEKIKKIMILSSSFSMNVLKRFHQKLK